jgi:SAM-dependent methyltransferase
VPASLIPSGPGTFLADLGERVGSLGRVAGVADTEKAARAAGALIGQLDLGRKVDIVRARIEDSGLAAGSFDMTFMRNVLVHNGPLRNVILQHIAALLRHARFTHPGRSHIPAGAAQLQGSIENLRNLWGKRPELASGRIHRVPRCLAPY